MNFQKYLTRLLVLTIAGALAMAVWAAPGQSNRKIIVFTPAVTGEVAQDKILAGHGLGKIKHLSLINASVAMLTDAEESELISSGVVVRIDDDAIATIAGKVTGGATAPKETLPWGVAQVAAPAVWDTNGNLVTDLGANIGTGIKVAVLDTGIDLTHADLKANIKGSYNAITTRKSATDDNGHGTHVAGTIAACDNTIGVIGVAPGAWLYAVKALDRTGSGYYSDIIEGIDWCITNKIQVINMSLGGPASDSLHDAIIRGYNAGIVLVAAAGNSGDAVGYPAAYPEVIAVSATDANNVIAYFSSRGPEVMLAAPGVDILSTYMGGAYAKMSGTSMACPHVVGIAALVIKAAGVTSPADVRARLQRATDLGDIIGKDNLYGYGLVTAPLALAPLAPLL